MSDADGKLGYPSDVTFDLAAEGDDTPSETDDDIRQEMNLGEHQLLVSKIYKMRWSEDVDDPHADIVVPVDVPERCRTGCSFWLWLKYDGCWHKTPTDVPVDGKIRGKVKKIDAFGVVAEDPQSGAASVESKRIGPEGGTFVAQTDGRITVYFPEGAVDKDTDFQFKSMVVDKERYEGYLKLNDSFTCIQGFTNILAVTPEIELKRPAKVCLPLDLHAKGDNSEVLFVHWKESEEDRGAEVIGIIPKEEPKNSYSVDVTSFSSYAPVCVPKKTSLEDIATSVEFISGKRSMCNILTLSSYDTKYKMHRLLMDCVDFYKVNSAIERHQQDGMREIEMSRSRDIQLKRKTRIKVSLEGNLTYLDKNLKVNYLKYDCYARTNKITMPVKSSGRSMSIVRYTWERENHQVFFFLDKQTLGSSSRSKAQHRKSSQSSCGSSTLTSRNVGNNGASSEENVSSTSPLDLHQRDVTGSQNHRLDHPVLSDKSLSALSDSLPQVVWRSMGLELNFTSDEICSIFEKAERRKSDPRFELLREWKTISRGTSESLINDLVAALEEIGRHDVAEMLRLATRERREIRRKDFNGRAGRQKAVIRLPTVRDGHFIYPDVN